jgi:Fic family protein
VLQPVVTFEEAAVIDEAERSTRALDSDPRVLGLEAVGPLLLRSEAIASSRIEGLELSPRNLARALIDPRAAKGTALAVADNVLAMEEAIAIGERPVRLRVDDILAIHATLMRGADPRTRPGALREQQNWIGGRLASPLDARYVPPPEDSVPGLVDDLIGFLNERDDVPPVAQAAIVHAQFETIHPFVDGNGRVGRCLIHLVLKRRGVVTAFVPPVSTVLAARPDAYIDGLVRFREGDVAGWCASFAEATVRAATSALGLARQVVDLEMTWLERAGRPRRDSAAARIIPLLPAQPILSAATIRAALGVRHQRAAEGLDVLERTGVIRKVSEGRYDKQYAADEIFELVERYEEDMLRG